MSEMTFGPAAAAVGLRPCPRAPLSFMPQEQTREPGSIANPCRPPKARCVACRSAGFCAAPHRLLQASPLALSACADVGQAWVGQASAMHASKASSSAASQLSLPTGLTQSQMHAVSCHALAAVRRIVEGGARLGAGLASIGLSTSPAGPEPSWPKWFAPHMWTLPSSLMHPATRRACSGQAMLPARALRTHMHAHALFCSSLALPGSMTTCRAPAQARLLSCESGIVAG